MKELQESLVKANHGIAFVCEDLLQALHKANPFQAIIIEALIKDVAESHNKIKQLCAAVNEEICHGN